ncbi:MAG: sigma-54-dependent Fis family transcriptional regulator, partial [Mariprofundaceae bacterium]
MAENFIQRFNRDKDAEITGISDDARRAMLHYTWPGNVRELQNLIERVTTLKRQGVLKLEDLPSRMISDKDRLLQSFQMDVKTAS